VGSWGGETERRKARAKKFLAKSTRVIEIEKRHEKDNPKRNCFQKTPTISGGYPFEEIWGLIKCKFNHLGGKTLSSVLDICYQVWKVGKSKECNPSQTEPCGEEWRSNFGESSRVKALMQGMRDLH